MILTGYFEEYTSIKSKSNYCEYTIYGKADNEKENHRIMCQCVGSYIYYINKGVPVKIEAELSQCRTFYVVKSIEVNIDDKEMFIKYLTSSKIKGLGEKSATKLVNQLDVNFLYEYEREDYLEKLTQIKGISLRIATEIRDLFSNNKVEKEVFDYLYIYGCDLLDIQRFCQEWKENTLEEIKKNPYILFKKFQVPLNVCEKIAYLEKIPFNHPSRIKSLIRNAIDLSNSDGHIYIDIKELWNYIDNSLSKNEKNIYPESINRYLIIHYLFDMDDVVIKEIDGNLKIFLKKYFIYEKGIYNKLICIQDAKKETLIKNISFDKFKIQYSKEQKEAFNLLKSTGLKVITGGPGTGKTTTLKGLISLYKSYYPNNEITLCAPTGKASQRMKESIGMGMEAHTICQLLKIIPDINSFDFSSALNSDLIIIDEASMLDSETAYHFFQKIKNTAIILLVGDCNQLPSVGAGNVLNDIIESELFEVVRLKHIFRQGEESSIVTNANYILENNVNLKTDSDFIIQEFDSINNIYSMIKNMPLDELKKIQFLTPQRKTKKGCQAQNKIIQDLLSKEFVLENVGITYNDTVFHVNDKVLFCRNNYEKKYMNGDIGIVLHTDGCSILSIQLGDNVIELTKNELYDIQLAYSMTIHKSQGSEYPEVYIILPNSIMLNQKILYTAITRAKEKVVILSEKGALRKAITTKKIEKRNSSLLFWFQGNLSQNI